MELTPEQLRKKYLELPEDLREAIFSIDSATVIQQIGKKHNLTVYQLGQLANDVGLVMLGLLPPREFIPRLQKDIEIDAEKARGIAKEVNEKIFAKIRESLKKVYKIGEESGKEEGRVETSPIKDVSGQKVPGIKEAPAAENSPSQPSVAPTGSLGEVKVSSESVSEGVENLNQKNPFEEKLAGEERIVSIEKDGEEKPGKEDGQGQKQPPAPPKGLLADERYPEGDPYREPIE